MNAMVVSLKILLGVEMVGSRRVAHYFRMSLEINNDFFDDDSLVWHQVPPYDHRIPRSGILYISDRGASIRFRIWNPSRYKSTIRLTTSRNFDPEKYDYYYFYLEGLTSLNSGTSGRGLCKLSRSDCMFILSKKDRHVPSPSNIKNVRTRGTGIWEITSNRWDGGSVNTRYLTSAWKVGGSGAIGGGAAIVGTAGYFTLTDPQRNDWTYAYSGMGLGAGMKSQGRLKEILKQMGNGKSIGIEWLPSANGILKNPLSQGGKELEKEDFCGIAHWFEASLLFGLGVSGTVFLIQRDDRYMPSVLILMAGVSVGGGAGAGVLEGRISLA